MIEREEIRESNYARLCEDWRLKFLSMDQDLLMKKLPELQVEGEYLTVYHFARKYGVNRKTGHIAAMEDERPVSNDVKLNIYNLFWYSKEGSFLQNRWVPFRDVKSAGQFDSAYKKHVLIPFALTFTGKVKELCEAAEKMGGVRVPQGDAGYILKCFDCIPMQYLFWDKDDEFEAQGNILFDYSVTDYIHVESTVSLAIEGIMRLAEVAGIEIKGNIFGMG
ncbi:MAG: DUF3786 domain-containing protein [Lachnospiraceae bacterium]|nr:DUF3786 domain-containing protein [Lachnospiraceae bacterium]